MEERYEMFNKHNHNEAMRDIKDGQIYSLESTIDMLNEKEERINRLEKELDIMVDIFDQSGLDWMPMTEEELDEYENE